MLEVMKKADMKEVVEKIEENIYQDDNEYTDIVYDTLRDWLYAGDGTFYYTYLNINTENISKMFNLFLDKLTYQIYVITNRDINLSLIIKPVTIFYYFNNALYIPDILDIRKISKEPEKYKRRVKEIFSDALEQSGLKYMIARALSNLNVGTINNNIEAYAYGLINATIDSLEDDFYNYHKRFVLNNVSILDILKDTIKDFNGDFFATLVKLTYIPESDKHRKALKNLSNISPEEFMISNIESRINVKCIGVLFVVSKERSYG